ncbi:hypothetical protein CYY_005703 [Polysphondylium violaceum]|uniref:C2H2-type domain-containing protein n=1 Tax=Polysphondylium violaceum TaxID=133409 RepID=A0A8J4US02_9MYCE|nr:hypothetical protein CYY_005703 [Polysphondylium violaceum]
MSSTLLEKTRNLHESIERYELLIEHEMKSTPKTTKENVLQNHRVNHYLNSSIKCANNLIEIYSDQDNTRADELSSLSRQGKLFSDFYDKLKEVKEYHRKFPNIKEDRNNVPLLFTPNVLFSGNESNGKFLDLNEIYEDYINLCTTSTKIDYITFLGSFYMFTYNDISRMKVLAYREYLDKIYKYLVSFIERTQPLLDLNQTISKCEAEFTDKWDNSDYFNKENTSNNNSNNENTELTEQEKSPLYCKACKKLFASENVFNGHLKGKKHIQSTERMNSNNNNEFKARKPTSLLEFKILKLATHLFDQIDATKENVLKKQSRKYSENEFEEDEEEDEEDITNIDDFEVPTEEPTKHRIANYPVDALSGKPLPYWVYNYLELGVEYKCEICGNRAYRGRKAYEKHFQDTRHSYGMSCIGVPNTIHFHEITKIKDALELWAKIKDQSSKSAFRSDRDEEYEDENGDVMSKKTYEMLVKQGLIKPKRK